VVTDPERPSTVSARRCVLQWLVNTTAMVGAAAITLQLFVGFSNLTTIRMQMRLEKIVENIQFFAAELCGLERHGRLLYPPGVGNAITFETTASTDFVNYLPVLLLGLLLATLGAARRVGVGIVGILLLLLSVAAVVIMGVPFISAFLQGVSAAVPATGRTLAWGYALSKDIAPMLVCIAVVLVWQLPRWLFIEDKAAAPLTLKRPHVRPAESWAAVGAATTAFVLLTLTFAGSFAAGPHDELSLVRHGRFLGEMVLAAVGVLVLIVALVWGRPNQWAWMPWLAMTPLGGGAAAGFALALSALTGLMSPRVGNGGG
jgi:hypothetical protein